jgi:hypothetical protein
VQLETLWSGELYRARCVQLETPNFSDLSSGLLLRLSRAETNQLGGESYRCEVWMAETDMLMMRVTLLRWICRKWSNVCCCGGALDERGETN